MFKSINPTTGVTIREYQETDLEDALGLVDRSAEAFHSWKSTAISKRSDYLMAVAAELERRIEDMAQLITEEMGKPYADSKAELDCLDYFPTPAITISNFVQSMDIVEIINKFSRYVD